MDTQFNHEKLKVYQRAVAFCADVSELAATWESKHAIGDHLPRAAESVVENLAEASAAYSAVKESALDCAIGSALECAACLDIALAKQLNDESETDQRKAEVRQVVSMLIGLRKAWNVGAVREEAGEYGTEPLPATPRAWFSHERLDAYVVGLDAVRWFCALDAASSIPVRSFRNLDSCLTSMLLNIAEGNGRFSHQDHRRFLEIAHRAAIKAAAHTDVCVCRGVFGADEARRGKAALIRVAMMTGAMIKAFAGSGTR